jgi:xanthine dehydrogenase molybdenum-binding subunit
MSATPASGSLIGARIPKLDAPPKAAGETLYLPDLFVPGMLHGKILRADRVHARIRSIDTRAAKMIPGVFAVITAKDIENIPFGHGKDNTPLKGEVVRCVRDEIAAVAAETEELAEEACRAIRVEYEDLPAIFDPALALGPGAAPIHEGRANLAFTYDYSHGDVEKGAAASAHIVETEYQLQFMTHCCLGTSAILAEFGAEGKLTLHSLTQVPFLYRRDMAAVVGMAPEDIRVIQPPIGGAFGSKLDIYPYEPIAVHLARAAGRPVRLVFTRREEFISSPTRQPARIKLRSGCDAEGRLTFRDAFILLDNGAYTSWGATTPFVMMQTFSSLYRVPHVKFRTEVAYTNNPYSGSFRGYGNLQATFAVESQLDMLAEKAGIDALEIRRRNAQEPGELTGQGMKFVTCGLRDCLDSAAKLSGWSGKRAEHSAPGSRVRRGIGIASMLHVGGGAKIYRSDGCGSLLSIDDFGKVTLITGSTDIGQGSETVLAQMVAEVLGVGLERVKVINTDTDVKPWDVGVHASRTSYVAGNSAILAARQAREKLLEAAAEHLAVPVGTLDLVDGWIVRGKEKLEPLDRLVRTLHFSGKGELLVTQAYFEPSSVKQDKGFHGNVSPTYAFGTHAVEVEVELDTGQIRVLGVSAAHDVGKVLNALGIEGQIEGGIVMGLGYALSEELLVRRGKVENPGFRDYHLMTAPEVPPIRMDLIETEDPTGPFGAKGVGEAPAICVAAAVANAVYHATGVRFTKLPLTPERVLDGLIAAGVTADPAGPSEGKS